MDPVFQPETTAEHLLALFGAHGVEHFFLNPGTDSAPIQEAMITLPKAGVPIPTVHTSTFESVSLAAAHAYFQATGRPQCLFVHVDAGTQNLGAMMHDAFRDRAGVIIIAGKTPSSEADATRGGRSAYIQWLQDVPDQAGIVRSYAKLVFEVTRPEALAHSIGRAVQVASSYPAGPVYLTIARDVLMDPPALSASRTDRFATPMPAAMSKDALAHVTKLIVDAQRPVLITSRAGRNELGFTATSHLAELAGVTVVRGADGGPLSIPTLHAMHRRSQKAVAQAITTADLVLIVECDVPYIPRTFTPPAGATVVHIDPDPLKSTMPLWAYPVDYAVRADGPLALAQLVEELELVVAHSPEVAARFYDRVTADGHSELLAEEDAVTRAEITNLDVLDALNEVLDPSDIVIEEAVTNSRPFYEHLVRSVPGTIAGAFAPGLGWALGGAIGTKLAQPDRRVVAICGDGSFLFGVPSSALQMSAEMGAPFLTVILNNAGYRASRLPVYELFPKGESAAAADAVGTRFIAAADFAALAEACHASGERVEQCGELLDALKRGLTSIEAGRSAVIDIKITQN